MERLGPTLAGHPDVGLAAALLADQGAAVVEPEEPDRDRSVRVTGVDQDGVLPVVAELEVYGAPEEGGFDALGIAGEVVRVRLVLDVLVAAPEDRVVHGGGELAGPAADRVHDGAGDDRPGVEVARGAREQRGPPRALHRRAASCPREEMPSFA